MIGHEGSDTSLRRKSHISELLAGTIPHPYFEESIRALTTQMTFGAPQEIVLLVGPSGCGKTTAVSEMQRRIVRNEHCSDPVPFLPLLYQRAKHPERSRFDWKDFYIRILYDLNEPGMGRKIPISDDEYARLCVRAGPMDRSTAAVRRLVEKALCRRQVLWLIIDEAQDILSHVEGDELFNQLNTLKSLTDFTEAKLLMVGTYDLLKIWNLNGQLNRRTKLVHMRRFRFDSEAHMEEFERLLISFEHLLSAHVPAGLLVDRSEWLYDKTLGVTGLVKRAIEQAGIEMLAAGRKKITFTDLSAGVFFPDQLQTLRREIEFGEDRISGRSKPSVVNEVASKPIVSSANVRRPGRRNPAIDRVGDNEASPC